MIIVNTVPCTTNEINNNTLCAIAHGSAGGGICMSDIGGPLLISSGVIGIASWHQTPCGYFPVTKITNDYFFII